MALLLMNPIAGNSEDWVAAFDQHLPGLDIRTWPEVGDLTDIEYLAMGRPELDKLPELSNLKLMLTMLASVDGMLANPKLPDVPLVKGEPEGGDPSLTEYAVTLILSHHRQMPAYRQQQREHVWQPIPQKGASEQRVGFMGYGVMAKPVAGLLAKMGFDVAAWTRTPKPDAPIEMFHGDDGFDDFLARTDIAICLLPVTPHTKGILNETRIAQAREALGIASAQFEAYADLGRQLATITMTDDDVQDFHAALIFGDKAVPASPDDWTAQKRRAVGELGYLYDNGRGAEMDGRRGTAWGALNSVTEWTNHVKRHKASTDADRTNFVLYGKGAQLNAQARQLLVNQYQLAS